VETYCGLALSGQRLGCYPGLCVQAVGSGLCGQRLRARDDSALEVAPPAWPPAYGVHDDALYKSTAFTFTFTFTLYDDDDDDIQVSGPLSVTRSCYLFIVIDAELSAYSLVTGQKLLRLDYSNSLPPSDGKTPSLSLCSISLSVIFTVDVFILQSCSLVSTPPP